MAWIKGKKRSPETIEKIRAAKLGKYGINPEFFDLYAVLRRKVGSREARVIVIEHQRAAA